MTVVPLSGVTVFDHHGCYLAHLQPRTSMLPKLFRSHKPSCTHAPGHKRLHECVRQGLSGASQNAADSPTYAYIDLCTL